MNQSGLSLRGVRACLLDWIADGRHDPHHLQAILVHLCDHKEFESLGVENLAEGIVARPNRARDRAIARNLVRRISRQLGMDPARKPIQARGFLHRLLRLRNVLVRPKHQVRISCPPGWTLYRFADAVFSKATVDSVLGPTIRDLQDEYEEALSRGRHRKAAWIRVRGYWSFWSAVFAQLPISLAKRIYEIWRAAG